VTHHLKSWPLYFQPIWVRDKTFEIRWNDRDFHERDEIALEEYDEQTQEYTGRVVHGVITYLTDFRQQDGYVVFSFCETSREE
jgi:hypothetical protein